MGVGGNVESEMSSSVASDTPQTALPAEEVLKEDVQRSNGGHGTMVQASELADAHDGFDEKMLIGGGDEDASSSPAKQSKDQQASARSNDAGSSSDIDVTSNFDLSDAVRMIKSESSTAANVSALVASDTSKSRDTNLKERLKRIKSQVVNGLVKHAKSVAFREPVNAKALGIYPIYHQIIKDPMDLSTVKRKIDRGEYTSMQDCLDDIQLIWENAKLFNAPGHQVHQAALFMETLTQEKLAKLHRDEAAGVFDQPKEKKRPFMSMTQPKLPRSPPMPLSVTSVPPSASAATPMVSPPIRRPQRKTSLDLPGGEGSQRQRRTENLPELLKQCDLLLKDLMATKGSGSGVDHFLKVAPGSRRSVTTGEPLADPMDLQKVQKRMASGFYRHPLQLADDVRQIVTEAYGSCSASESAPREPLAAHASQLLHTFETLFAKRIDVLPVENPAQFYSPALRENEGFIGNVRSAMDQVLKIKENVNSLMGALSRMRREKASGRKAPSAMNNGPRKRGRPPNEGAGPAKKARTSAGTAASAAQPVPPAAVAMPPAAPASQHNKHTLTVQESMALREEVSMLNEIQQQKIVQIMMDNREVLVTDANGFTEIDLGNCTAKTIKEIQGYIESTKPGANSAAAVAAAPTASSSSLAKRPQHNNNLSGSSKRSSPQKQNRSGDGNLSDSSSGSSGDSDSSSSSDSSDSDSD